MLVRVFGMARQMLKTRAAHYDALNHAQRLCGIAMDAPTIDATPWVPWFVHAFTQACEASQAVVTGATEKTQFRLRAAQCHVNPRQSKVLERLLEAGHAGPSGGFLGGMTNEKYAKITGTSKATRYAANVPGWEQPVLKP